MSNYPRSIELARLFERTSARGTKYLLGQLGSARIVLLPGDPIDDRTPTWRLLVQERAEAAERAHPATSEADRFVPAQPARQRRRAAYAAHRRSDGVGAADPRPFDDEIPFG